ncbi:preprotein translocase subunit SecE [Micrococcales bacterium 31B]|nr:preprotein translocase subunit SecE [Micrococcales bacterium 31B]
MSENAVTVGGQKQVDKKRGLFARVALFVRQVVEELRKVVRPTPKELTNYSIVVLVFLLVFMLAVFGIDYGLNALAGFAFTN